MDANNDEYAFRIFLDNKINYQLTDYKRIFVTATNRVIAPMKIVEESPDSIEQHTG